MGVNRSEHVMMGLFLKVLPFDQWDDKYLPYIEGWKDETLSIIEINQVCGDEGYVIGRIVVDGDNYEGIKLTEIKDTPAQSEVMEEILEKLKISATEEEIKLYIFSHWS